MHFLLWSTEPIIVPILTLSIALVKVCQIPHVVFQSTSSFFFKVCIIVQRKITPLYSFKSNIVYLALKELIKVQMFETFG